MVNFGYPYNDIVICKDSTDYLPKDSLTPCGEKFFWMEGHDLAVRGVSKYKVDMIFIIFREFNTMLEIVDS